jgi:hypothetical protein
MIASKLQVKGARGHLAHGLPQKGGNILPGEAMSMAETRVFIGLLISHAALVKNAQIY